MFIVDLECKNAHRFEGWYERAAEFETLRDNGEVTCPLCESADITQRLQTGQIKTTKTVARRHPETPPLEVQKALAKVVQRVRQTHDDVGDQFAERARAMHRGTEEARPILGQSTPNERQALREEGVPFASLPIPDIEKN